jgi:hypothetical protein
MGEMGYRELRRRVRWVLVLWRWNDALVVGGSVGDAVSGAGAWRVFLVEVATLHLLWFHQHITVVVHVTLQNCTAFIYRFLYFLIALVEAFAFER